MRERTVHLALRATPAEATLIRHMADAALLTTSSYLRTIALQGDQRLPRLQSLQAELRRLGGLQKHLASKRSWQYEERQQFERITEQIVATLRAIAHAGQSHHA
ncbi:MAG: hypothetical protein B7X31_14545 [Thiomonas sp. 13-66-29]|jgi:hypothetical protein|nr:MAG: hypothetical protein B7Z83_04995 [Thiomonas sp. 20-64-5]OZB44510.1 MAG: hypothetical protein B7X46_08540 [Thiomonas sp. 15-66-11]OZB53579.1 MAG: hypothetical protein B7X42_02910 [Thiomonas sp. 14-66-4]OZB57797.1 MAG: hypothetical protein B7X31_14545 [Thiomonas sp. 13-66-29]